MTVDRSPTRLPLAALAARQGSVFTRKQALAAGLTHARIETLLRRKAWLAVGYGCYCIAAQSDPEYAHARTCAARLLGSSGDPLVSHDSAGVLLELPYVEVPARPTLTSARNGPPEHRNGMFAAAIPTEHRVEVFGFTVTSGPRTLVDLLRNAPDELVAQSLADGGLRAEIGLVQLQGVLGVCAGWPGIARARAALTFAEPRCESPLESHNRIWFRDGGLPAPTPQYLVRNADGKPIARVDFCFKQQRVVVECDGQIKYRKGSSWQAKPEETLWAEKLREDKVRDQGYEVVRSYAKDGQDAGAALCRRIHQAAARAARRF